jgi:glycosyltransferase involved in cell wall biosynthesis
MHLAMVSHAYDPQYSSPDALLNRYTSLTGWTEAMVARGWKVTVLQRYREHSQLVRNGVEYHFVADALSPMLRFWQIPTTLHRKVAEVNANVVHSNGLVFPLQVHHLARMVAPTPLIVQHHAERPRVGWRRLIQKIGLSRAGGFFFVSKEQAEMFRTAGIIRANQPIFEVMEGSTYFRQQPRDIARRATGLSGTPQFLWIGRLIPLKNPLVVLDGFAQVVEQYPQARLAMIYHEAPLLAEVQAKIERTPALKRTVTLIGEIPNAMIETYLSSADYFVLGSNYEGSGYALAEAMACGVIPLVTDIASFRMMTNGGKVGALWQVGSVESMVAKTHELLKRNHAEESARVKDFFSQRLSYSAIGRDAEAAYHTLITAGRAA